MNADRFARVAIPAHIPDRAPANRALASIEWQPSVAVMYAGMDDMGDYFAMSQVCRPSPIGEADDSADDEHQSISLRLGDATVDVDYIVVCGCPLVQGATINEAWVNADVFSSSVTAKWRRSIEAARGQA